MKKRAYIAFFALIFIPIYANAEIKTITASHTYIMGDNDSKNDARRMCFLEAKRKVLEKAGSYIETRSEVKNYQLTEDEISAYSAALLKVDTVKEQWKFRGENMAIEISVKAEVDTGYIEKQLTRIIKDTSVQKKIRDQQGRLQELERRVVNLQKQLGTRDASEAAILRKERNVTFKQIDELQAKKISIVDRIRSKNRDARNLIVKGMTMSDVKSLLGPPDAKDNVPPADWYYGYA